MGGDREEKPSNPPSYDGGGAEDAREEVAPMETSSHLCKTRCPNDDDVSRGRPEPEVEGGGGDVQEPAKVLHR